MNYESLSLKYQRFPLSGFKEIGIRKFECVVKFFSGKIYPLFQKKKNSFQKLDFFCDEQQRKVIKRIKIWYKAPPHVQQK